MKNSKYSDMILVFKTFTRVCQKMTLFIALGTIVSHTASAEDFRTEYPEYTGTVKDVRAETLLGVRSFSSGYSTANAEKIQRAYDFRKYAQYSVVPLDQGCSGVLVSDEGHILTALHCIGIHAATTKEIGKIKDSNDRIQSLTVSVPIVDATEYSFKLLTNLYLDPEDLNPVKIVAVGKGGWPDFESGLRALDPNSLEVKTARENYDDFAIIKLKGMPKDHACVRIGMESPANRELVWVAGYPSLSIENTLHIGVGRAYSNFAMATERFPYPVRGTQLLDALTTTEQSFVSTTLTGKGFSGGGVFNTEGFLIGINTMKPASPSFHMDNLSPFTSHIKLSHIRNQIVQIYGEEKAATIFNCKQSKF